MYVDRKNVKETRNRIIDPELYRTILYGTVPYKSKSKK